MPKVTDVFEFDPDYSNRIFINIYDRDENSFNQLLFKPFVNSTHPDYPDDGTPRDTIKDRMKSDVVLMLNRNNELWNHCKTNAVQNQYIDDINEAIEQEEQWEQYSKGKLPIFTKEEKSKIAAECVYNHLSKGGLNNLFLKYNNKHVNALCMKANDYFVANNFPFADDDYWMMRIGRPMAQLLLCDEEIKKPFVLSARPGLGKTEMLVQSIKYRLKTNPDFRALIVTNFIEEGKRIARDIDPDPDKNNICMLLPSMYSVIKEDGECLAGYTDYENDWRKCTECKYKRKFPNCDVLKKEESLEKYPILIITTNRFKHSLSDDTFDKYLKSTRGKRDHIFIDENPQLISSFILTTNILEEGFRHLRDNKDHFTDEDIDEYKYTFQLLSPEFYDDRNTEPLQTDWHFSDAFKNRWKKKPYIINDTKRNRENVLEWIEQIIRSGYIRQITFEKLAASTLRKIEGKAKRIIILDGSGMLDPSYHVYNYDKCILREMRSFDNLTFHRNTTSLSKSVFDKNYSTFEELVKDIPELSEGKESLIISYSNKDKKKDRTEQIKKIIPITNNLKIDHFGNLRGKNDYRECVNLFIFGMNTWDHMDYYLNYWASTGKKPDANLKRSIIDDSNVKEYSYHLRVTELYQDILRIKHRNYNCDEPTNVYLTVNNDDIFNELIALFPGCKVKKWQPNAICLGKFKSQYQAPEKEDRYNKKRLIELTKYIYKYCKLDRVPTIEEYKLAFNPGEDKLNSIKKNWSRDIKDAQKVLDGLKSMGNTS